MGFIQRYEIKKSYLTAPSSRRSGLKMPKVTFMVAHDTGNPTSTAKNNVSYYERSRNEMSASAHLFVDDKEIIECVPFLTGTPEKAWHVIYNVTTDNLMYGSDANDTAGGVELCWGAGINSAEAYKRYVWVLAYACYKYSLNPAKAIVGHEILDPKRKVDPSNGLKYMGKTYQQLLQDVIAEYNACLTPTSSTPIVPEPSLIGTTYTIQKGDTLWQIAQRFRNTNLTVQDLLLWNPGIKAESLQVGQVIKTSKPTTATPNQPSTPAKPTTPTKKYPIPTKVLKRGNTGADVLALQKALCAVFFYPDKVAKDQGCDGSFGPKTESALKRFQSVHANPIDGTLNVKTQVALDKLANK